MAKKTAKKGGEKPIEQLRKLLAECDLCNVMNELVAFMGAVVSDKENEVSNTGEQLRQLEEIHEALACYDGNC